jgi:hypothetical protein
VQKKARPALKVIAATEGYRVFFDK